MCVAAMRSYTMYGFNSVEAGIQASGIRAASQSGEYLDPRCLTHDPRTI